VMRRSGTGPAKSRAGRVPSLPMPAIHPPRQPAIPDEGRSPRNIALRHMAHDTRATRFSPQSFARDPRGFGISMRLARTRFRQGATARRPREHDFAGDRWHGFREWNDICHSRLTEANRTMKADVQIRRFRAAEPRKLRFDAVLDHERDCANRLVQLIAGREEFR